jgi:hypothetical protein
MVTFSIANTVTDLIQAMCSGSAGADLAVEHLDFAEWG